MVEDLRTCPFGYALELNYEDYLWDNRNEKYENDMKCSEKCLYEMKYSEREQYI